MGDATGETGNPGFDIWVEFNDLDPGGIAGTYHIPAGVIFGAEMTEVTAGDYEGNRCPATVVATKDGIVVRLDLDRFQPAHRQENPCP